MEISFNIDDWRDETMRTEEQPKNIDDLANLALEQGYLSPQLFRMYAYLREEGIADPDALPSNKTLFQTGGTVTLASRFQVYKKIIEINGKQHEGRAMIAPRTRPVVDKGDGEEVKDGDDGLPTTWQSSGTPEAADLAWRYIERNIPGLIWGRLLVLVDSKGDVKGAANMLHDKIDEMVERLT